MSGYLYASSADQVNVGTTRHTVLQLGTPAGIPISIVRFTITFDGTTPSAVPALVTLERQASAGTGGVALTANWGPNPLDPNNPATTVTALKGPWATTEPALTSIYEVFRISPTAGLPYPIALDQEPVCPASSWIGVTVTAAATVNATLTMVHRQGP